MSVFPFGQTQRVTFGVGSGCDPRQPPAIVNRMDRVTHLPDKSEQILHRVPRGGAGLGRCLQKEDRLELPKCLPPAGQHGQLGALHVDLHHIEPRDIALRHEVVQSNHRKAAGDFLHAIARKGSREAEVLAPIAGGAALSIKIEESRGLAQRRLNDANVPEAVRLHVGAEPISNGAVRLERVDGAALYSLGRKNSVLALIGPGVEEDHLRPQNLVEQDKLGSGVAASPEHLTADVRIQPAMKFEIAIEVTDENLPTRAGVPLSDLLRDQIQPAHPIEPTGERSSMA